MSRLIDRIPIPQGVNAGLDGVSNRLALSILGNPRSRYSSSCQPVTNPGLAPHIITESVGPFPGMHFEISKQLLMSWHADILPETSHAADERLTLGDRGARVAELQRKLNAGGEDLVVDGVFGRDTLAAVMAFQSASGLDVTGVVDRKTWDRL
ncbi:peptidoglycan-binding domain-containing protein [Methylocystis sp. IM3]|jgi:hypothetical protein|uniref:peptidoglycan-binding domain-containing protein n=1 Tax=unclassified Methylocystis TaxID=2625913 RepID=UPI0030FC4C6C